MDNIDDKLRNLEEWNRERAMVKPFVDKAVDFHNRARAEARWRNYNEAARLYKEAILNYKEAVSKGPKYYLHDLLDRIDNVIGEYINNSFNLRVMDNGLKSERGIEEFLCFMGKLKSEEQKSLDSFSIANAYFSIGEHYYEEKNFKKAYDFYNKAIDIGCARPFINRDAYLKAGKILFMEGRFKEALAAFVSVLSFDRFNNEAADYIDNCVKRLGISEYKDKFLAATPNEAKKLIMEVL